MAPQSQFRDIVNNYLLVHHHFLILHLLHYHHDRLQGALLVTLNYLTGFHFYLELIPLLFPIHQQTADSDEYINVMHDELKALHQNHI